MIKNRVIALVATAALAGVALPAMAAPATHTSDFDSDYVLYELQSKGVNATAVEQWGSYVRAFVVNADGTQGMQLYTPDTLAPVNF